MNHLLLLFLLLTAAVIVFAGCCRKNTELPQEKDFVLLDVRSKAEFDSGHLPGAVNIPHDVIGDKISSVVTDKNKVLYLYCRTGRRVEFARKTLKKLNYTKIYNLGGLKQAAKTLKLPIEKSGN